MIRASLVILFCMVALSKHSCFSLKSVLAPNHFAQLKPKRLWREFGTFFSAMMISSQPFVASAADLPPLPKCFAAIRAELNNGGTKSLSRLETDINTGNWDDIKTWSREFDAGFRGGVLKSVWKQLDGDDKKRGIELSNSFTFDLIALNKAARNADKDDALQRIASVRQDLLDFLTLDKAK